MVETHDTPEAMDQLLAEAKRDLQKFEDNVGFRRLLQRLRTASPAHPILLARLLFGVMTMLCILSGVVVMSIPLLSDDAARTVLMFESIIPYVPAGVPALPAVFGVLAGCMAVAWAMSTGAALAIGREAHLLPWEQKKHQKLVNDIARLASQKAVMGRIRATPAGTRPRIASPAAAVGRSHAPAYGLPELSRSAAPRTTAASPDPAPGYTPFDRNPTPSYSPQREPSSRRAGGWQDPAPTPGGFGRTAYGPPVDAQPMPTPPAPPQLQAPPPMAPPIASPRIGGGFGASSGLASRAPLPQSTQSGPIEIALGPDLSASEPPPDQPTVVPTNGLGPRQSTPAGGIRLGTPQGGSPAPARPQPPPALAAPPKASPAPARVVADARGIGEISGPRPRGTAPTIPPPSALPRPPILSAPPEDDLTEDFAAEDFAAEDFAAEDFAAEDYRVDDFATEALHAEVFLEDEIEEDSGILARARSGSLGARSTPYGSAGRIRPSTVTLGKSTKGGTPLGAAPRAGVTVGGRPKLPPIQYDAIQVAPPPSDRVPVKSTAPEIEDLLPTEMPLDDLLEIDEDENPTFVGDADRGVFPVGGIRDGWLREAIAKSNELARSFPPQASIAYSQEPNLPFTLVIEHATPAMAVRAMVNFVEFLAGIYTPPRARIELIEVAQLDQRFHRNVEAALEPFFGNNVVVEPGPGRVNIRFTDPDPGWGHYPRLPDR